MEYGRPFIFRETSHFSQYKFDINLILNLQTCFDVFYDDDEDDYTNFFT